VVGSGSPSVHFESESPVPVNRPWLLHMAIKTTHTILYPFKATARTINANASTIPDIERHKENDPCEISPTTFI